MTHTDQTGSQALNDIEMFLEMLSAERGAAPNTLAAYARDLSEFAAFLSEHGMASRAVPTDDIRDFFHIVAGRGLAASSQARKLSAVRQFFRFLHAEGLRSDNPAAAIESPKQQRPLPKIISIDEVDGLLEAARSWTALAEGGERLRALRFYCLLEVLYATGLRVSELVALPGHVLQSEQRVLLIKGKGGRERLVLLTGAAREALKRYQEALGQEHKQSHPNTWLFPSRAKQGHLTRQRFAQELKRVAAMAGLDPQTLITPTCSATPSPATCSSAARICAPFSNCWATPISRRRKFIPTFSKNACEALSTNTIPLRANAWRRRNKVNLIGSDPLCRCLTDGKLKATNAKETAR